MTLQLRGKRLQTDGSDHNILIANITLNGTLHESLLCQPELTNITLENGDLIYWYLNNGKLNSTGSRGWIPESVRFFNTSNTFLKRVSDTAEEGVFTCHIDGDINPSVSIGVYYPSK